MMMKKLFLSIAFCLTYLFLSAQGWSVNYIGDYPSGRTHFHDGFIDEDGVTFLAGQEGPSTNMPKALFMRIEPDGSHTEYKYVKEGYYSRATCIIEMHNHNLFVAGNLYGETDDYLLVLILDKHLNLLAERHFAKEVEGNSFGASKAMLDSHDNVIVSTFVSQNNAYQGFDYRGIFFKFDQLGNLKTRRYLYEDYPDPVYFLWDFKMRQMWYKAEEEHLLCLVPGYGNVLSFITFDSAFNYIDEYQIWQEDINKSDHTIADDCYTDHWLSENEALFFSSLGDSEHNKLRHSRINTHGEILELRPLNERTDTIDDAATTRCMATVNDSTFYFSFYYHTWAYYPGTACVYQLNHRMEIVGRHLDDNHQCYRTYMVLPTTDGGCITVNDSCNYYGITSKSHPIVSKLSPDDFETVPLSVSSVQSPPDPKAYPNPCEESLHIPIAHLGNQQLRCQVHDYLGRTVIDRMVPHGCNILHLDVSRLRTGNYHYRIYTDKETLFTEQFIKK